MPQGEKISSLIETNEPTDNALFVLAENGTNRSVNFSNLKNLFSKTDSEITVNLGSENAGSYETGDVIPSGTCFFDIFMNMLIKAIPPTYVNPTLSLSTDNTPLVKEVGIALIATFSPAFSQNDAGSVVEYRLLLDSPSQSDIPIATISGSTGDGLDNRALAEGNYIYHGEVDFNDGAILNDNLGNPSPGGQILAGTVSSNNIIYNAVYPFFYGISNDGVVGNIDVYSDGTKNVSVIGSSISANYNGSGFLWFAVPSSNNNPKTYTSWFINELNQGSIGGASNLFGDPTTVSVTSSGLTNNYTINYDIYITNFSTNADTIILS